MGRWRTFCAVPSAPTNRGGEERPEGYPTPAAHYAPLLLLGAIGSTSSRTSPSRDRRVPQRLRMRWSSRTSNHKLWPGSEKHQRGPDGALGATSPPVLSTRGGFAHSCTHSTALPERPRLTPPLEEHQHNPGAPRRRADLHEGAQTSTRTLDQEQEQERQLAKTKKTKLGGEHREPPPACWREPPALPTTRRPRAEPHAHTRGPRSNPTDLTIEWPIYPLQRVPTPERPSLEESGR